MSKIEDALNLAKERRWDFGGDKEKKRRSGDRRMQVRQIRQDNDGADWIATLRVEEPDVIGDPESRVIIGDNQTEEIRSAYKILRTRTLHRMRQNNWHVIGVTSPLQGDGKSLTSVNLALSLAREVTLSVILLELDLRRPSICEQFGVNPVVGLSSYLDGKVELEQALFRPAGTERLAILPNTEIFENSSETLSSPKLAALLQELRGSDPGRIIVCDLPPYLATDDVLAFAPLADAFLVVVSEGKTSRDVLDHGLDILQELPLLGIVLNRSETTVSGYYY